MGMTLTQKILAAHAGLPEVKAGQLINAKLDIVLGNDITTPVAINEFEKAGFDGVFDKEHIAIVLDHFVPNKDIKSATQSKQCREFANKYDILNFYDVGQMGVEHALLPEKGIVTAGDCIIGADSHTCTYGALGAFSTGVGSTDMAAGMATGMAWFKVPSAIKFVLKGKFSPRVSGKDLILHIIGMIGVDGALYKSMEFTGPGVASLTMEDRLCVCNMALEAGAKNGIFPVDEVTRAYLNGRSQRTPVYYEADPDAEYEKTIEIDLDKLEPTVSYPHLPENTHPASDGKDIRIDQVVIGSCTNGRLEDMEAAYNILKGKHIAKGVRGIIIPATMAVYKECILRGWTEAFIDAGCIVSTPTCGPCLGGYMGILAEGERCVSTTNRNFVGRMGHVKSEVYLASPATAAASALTGYITEGQIILSRDLYRKGLQPPSDVLPSLSRLKDKGIGEGKTRADHADTMNQLFSAYARGKEAKELMVVLGEAALTDIDRIYARFSDAFEAEYVSQGYNTNRDIEQTLEIGWKLLSMLPRSELKRIKDAYIDKYYKAQPQQ